MRRATLFRDNGAPKCRESGADGGSPGRAELRTSGSGPKFAKSSANVEETGPERAKPNSNAATSNLVRLCKGGGGPKCKRSGADINGADWTELLRSRDNSGCTLSGIGGENREPGRTSPNASSEGLNQARIFARIEKSRRRELSAGNGNSGHAEL